MNDLMIHRLDPGTDWRYELKLTCGAELLAQARDWIRLHPEGFRTANPSRIVNNIYLDTIELRSLNANLSSLSNKQKLRIRWYGEDTGRPVLELKYKQNWLGRKRRFNLPKSLDLSKSWSQILADVRANVPTSWQHLLEKMNQPTLINLYHREYYATLDGEIRVTLDYSQKVYNQRFTLRPNLRHCLPVEELLVIELKGASSQSIRLQQACSDFPICLSRNSRYAKNLRSALF